MPSGSVNWKRSAAPLQPCVEIPWLKLLTAPEIEHVAGALRYGVVAPGHYLAHTGQAADHWHGVMDGMLNICSYSDSGEIISFAGAMKGGWFGEGSVIKRENLRYNVRALRESKVARLPVDVFHWLLNRSCAFDRFVMSQLNERLAQFIFARQIDRMPDPAARVACNLMALLDPALNPGAGNVVPLTQQELADLIGLSRQQVNSALARMAAQGMVRVEYRRLQVLDPVALRDAAQRS